MKLCSRQQDDIDCVLYTHHRDLPAEWDALLPPGHALTSDQLALTEASSLPDISFLYGLVTHKGRAIAAAGFQLLRVRPGHINPGMVKRWQTRAWTLFTRAACPQLLVAGHLFRHDTRFFYYAPDITTYLAYQCFYTATQRALQNSCAGAVLVKDMPVELVDHFQNHAPQFLLLRNDISMEMTIPAEWELMQDYEKALKHKYAQRLRKIRKLWQDLTVKELSEADVAAQKDDLYRLYSQVVQHQQVRLGVLSPQFIVRLKQFYKEQLKIWAVYDGQEMIAFFSGWVKEEAFDMFYIGFDYARNSELQLYFNILFFSVEQAILLRKPKLILGRTALDAKARLGCEPQYLRTFLYIRNPLIRRFVVRKQQGVSLKEGDWEEKHPFKG